MKTLNSEQAVDLRGVIELELENIEASPQERIQILSYLLLRLAEKLGFESDDETLKFLHKDILAANSDALDVLSKKTDKAVAAEFLQNFKDTSPFYDLLNADETSLDKNIQRLGFYLEERNSHQKFNREGEEPAYLRMARNKPTPGSPYKNIPLDVWSNEEGAITILKFMQKIIKHELLKQKLEVEGPNEKIANLPPNKKSADEKATTHSEKQLELATEELIKKNRKETPKEVARETQPVSVEKSTPLPLSLETKINKDEKRIGANHCINVSLQKSTKSAFDRIEITFTRGAKERLVSQVELMNFLGKHQNPYTALIDDENHMLPGSSVTQDGNYEVLEFYLVPPIILNKDRVETLSYYRSMIDKLQIPTEKKLELAKKVESWVASVSLPFPKDESLVQRVTRLGSAANSFKKLAEEQTDNESELQKAEQTYRVAANILLLKPEGSWGDPDYQAAEYLRHEMRNVTPGTKLISNRLLYRNAREQFLKGIRCTKISKDEVQNVSLSQEYFTNALTLLTTAYQSILERVNFKSDMMRELDLKESDYLEGREVSLHHAKKQFGEEDNLKEITLVYNILNTIRECHKRLPKTDQKVVLHFNETFLDFEEYLKTLRQLKIAPPSLSNDVKNAAKEEKDALQAPHAAALNFGQYLERISETRPHSEETKVLADKILGHIIAPRKVEPKQTLLLGANNNEEKISNHAAAVVVAAAPAVASPSAETAKTHIDAAASAAAPPVAVTPASQISWVISDQTSYDDIEQKLTHNINSTIYPTRFDFEISEDKEELNFTTVTTGLNVFAAQKVNDTVTAMREIQLFIQSKIKAYNNLPPEMQAQGSTHPDVVQISGAKFITKVLATDSQLAGWSHFEQYAQDPSGYVSRMTTRNRDRGASSQSAPQAFPFPAGPQTLGSSATTPTQASAFTVLAALHPHISTLPTRGAAPTFNRQNTGALSAEAAGGPSTRVLLPAASLTGSGNQFFVPTGVGPDMKIQGPEASVDFSQVAANANQEQQAKAIGRSAASVLTVAELQQKGQLLIQRMLKRLQWFIRKQQQAKKPFSAPLALELLYYDHAWFTDSNAFMNAAEVTVTQLLKHNSAKFGVFRDLQRRGVAWPHSPNVRRDIEAAGFAFRPMMIKRDRCVCDGCGAEIAGWRAWMNPWGLHDLSKHNKDFKEKVEEHLALDPPCYAAPVVSQLAFVTDLKANTGNSKLESKLGSSNTPSILKIISTDAKEIESYTASSPVFQIDFVGYDNASLIKNWDSIFKQLAKNYFLQRINFKDCHFKMDEEFRSLCHKIFAASVKHPHLLRIDFGKVANKEFLFEDDSKSIQVDARLRPVDKVKRAQQKEKQYYRAYYFPPDKDGKLVVGIRDDLTFIDKKKKISDVLHKIVSMSWSSTLIKALGEQYDANFDARDKFGFTPEAYALTKEIKDVCIAYKTKPVLTQQNKPLSYSIFPESKQVAAQTITVQFVLPTKNCVEENHESPTFTALISSLSAEDILGAKSTITIFNRKEHETFIPHFVVGEGLEGASAEGNDDTISGHATLTLEVPYSEKNYEAITSYLNGLKIPNLPNANVKKQIINAVNERDAKKLETLLRQNPKVNVNEIYNDKRLPIFPNSLQAYSPKDIDILRSIVLDGATSEKDFEVIKTLIECGADINKEPSVLACCPDDPDHQSNERHHTPGLEMFKYLLSIANINPNVFIKCGKRPSTPLPLWVIYLNTLPADTQMHKLMQLVMHPQYDFSVKSPYDFLGSKCKTGFDILTSAYEWLKDDTKWAKDLPTIKLGQLLLPLYLKRGFISNGLKNITARRDLKAEFAVQLEACKASVIQNIGVLIEGGLAANEILRLINEKIQVAREDIHFHRKKINKKLAYIEEISAARHNRVNPMDEKAPDADVIRRLKASIKEDEKEIAKIEKDLNENKAAVVAYREGSPRIKKFIEDAKSEHLVTYKVMKSVWEKITESAHAIDVQVECLPDGTIIWPPKNTNQLDRKNESKEAIAVQIQAAPAPVPVPVNAPAKPADGVPQASPAPAAMPVPAPANAPKFNFAAAQPQQKYPSTDIFSAIKNKDLAYVQREVKNGFDINSTRILLSAALKRKKIDGPIDFAADLYEATKDEGYLEIFNYLVSDRTTFSEKSIEERLGFCRRQIEEKSVEKNKLFDYAISRLTRNDYCELFLEEGNITRYLNAFQGKYSGDERDDGQHDILLSIRSRVLLEWIYELEQNNPEKIDINQLKRELIHNLETLSFFKNILKIPFNHVKQKLSFMPAAFNLVSRLNGLKENESITLPTGWPGHAMCMVFMKNKGSIIIRLDNLERIDRQDVVDMPNHKHGMKPKVIGQIPLHNLADNYDYLENLIETTYKFTSNDARLTYKRIFQNELLKHRNDCKEDLNLPLCEVQQPNNCYIKSFEPGLVMRNGAVLSQKIQQREIEYLRMLQKRFNNRIYSLSLSAFEKLEDNYKAFKTVPTVNASAVEQKVPKIAGALAPVSMAGSAAPLQNASIVEPVEQKSPPRKNNNDIENALNELLKAADQARPEDIPEIPLNYYCPISSDFMLEPVITTQGQTYNRAFIEEWLSKNDTDPLTAKKLESKALMKVPALVDATVQFLKTLTEKYVGKKLTIVGKFATPKVVVDTAPVPAQIHRLDS